MKRTVPLRSVAATVAVYVTCWPVIDGFADDARVVELAASAPTDWPSTGEADGA